MNFLAALSNTLMKDIRIKHNADVMSYAYWIRKASIVSMKEEHKDFQNRIGRGIAFHIAPSNIPVNFAVSMVYSLLAGNISIVRVSNKPFEQVEIICDAMNKVLEEQPSMKPYFYIVRYEHSDIITQKLSSICDLRIVWGGDRTIGEIRKAALPPRAIELTFADRYSLAVINSDFYMTQDATEVAKGFYTDTYYTDQNACNSPRLVVWTGGKVSEAKKRFWKELHKLVLRDYEMKPIQAVDKFSSLCALGMDRKGVHLASEDNYLVRVEVNELSDTLMNFKDSGGYFFEYEAKDLKEIVPVLTKRCQTVSVFGIEKQDIKNLVFANGVRGVDRIVQIGKTMELEFIWDGLKMIDAMSRFVYMGEYF